MEKKFEVHRSGYEIANQSCSGDLVDIQRLNFFFRFTAGMQRRTRIFSVGLILTNLGLQRSVRRLPPALRPVAEAVPLPTLHHGALGPSVAGLPCPATGTTL